MMIVTDLERNQFFLANYQKLLVNSKFVEHLDAHYDKNRSAVLMSILINEQLARYKNMYDTNNLSIGSLHCYTYIINKHLAYFNDISLKDVNTNLIETFISTLKFSKKRISGILVPLKQIFKHALKQGLIQINPLDKLAYSDWQSQAISSNYKIEPFTQGEISLILAACQYDTLRNLIQFAFWTGMRIGELFAITWDDIDFKAELIHINKSQTLKSLIKSPKTKAGNRDIEMTPFAKAALLAQFKITGQDLDKRIFKTPNGFIWSKSDMFRRYWEKILIKADVKYRNPHQMRHTFVSHILSIGNSPMILYRIIGHSNAEMIYKVYAKSISTGGKIKLLKTS